MSQNEHASASEDPEHPTQEIEIEAAFDVERDLGRAAAVVRPGRTMRPWHRPRKQYVRRHQWAASVETLIRDLKISDEISYLGLPGDEFLDIRYLADGPIAAAETTLRFLGFRQGVDDMEATVAGADIAELSALEETRNHPRVNARSRMQPDDLRRLSSERSPAFRASWRHGPFDVVNLDLTQSIFAKPLGDSLSYTEALRRLVGIQMTAQRDWLLWVTMRVDRHSVHLDEARRLLNLLCARFDDCTEVLDEWLPEHFDAQKPADIDLDSCSARDFAGVLLLGFCVWLSDIAQRPREHKMKVLSCMGYRVAAEMDEPCDIFSLAIRFTPRPVVPPDHTGVTTGFRPATSVPGPCERLVTFLKRHRKTVDVDARVLADPSLRSRLVDETATLLEGLGISRDEYEQWVVSFDT